MQFPDRIAGFVAGKTYTENLTGMSGSRVLMYDEYVLKIEKTRHEDLETIAVMRWLEGRIPVPVIAVYAEEDGFSYTLMSRVQGRMACDEHYLERPDELTTLLAEALHMLWSVDTAGCPRERSIDVELAEAKYRVERHLVDMDNVEPETFGPGGFRDPEELREVPILRDGIARDAVLVHQTEDGAGVFLCPLPCFGIIQAVLQVVDLNV